MYNLNFFLQSALVQNKLFLYKVSKTKAKCTLAIGVVHKLRLQEEGGRWSKNRLFVNFYTIENVNGGGRWSKKDKSCKRSL